MSESARRKHEQLKALNKFEDDRFIKSPLLNDPETNACIKEQNLSLKCMDDNDYDSTKCMDAIENYKTCQKFWTSISHRRFWAGIKPSFPPPEERDKIKKEEFAKLKDDIDKVKKFL